MYEHHDLTACSSGFMQSYSGLRLLPVLQKAEDFLKQARAPQQYTEAQAFDFVSVCPPYEKVSYEELYDLLEGSSLIHPESIVVVEYAKRLSHAIRDTIGPLHKVRDKRYGRTFVAVYGPTD